MRRLHCYFCAKSVSSEVPEETVVRGVLICQKCMEAMESIHPDIFLLDLANNVIRTVCTAGGTPPQTVARTPAWREGMGYLPPCTQCGGTGVIFLSQVLNAVEPCPICKGKWR